MIRYHHDMRFREQAIDAAIDWGQALDTGQASRCRYDPDHLNNDTIKPRCRRRIAADCRIRPALDAAR
jgi:hypothetical protein